MNPEQLLLLTSNLPKGYRSRIKESTGYCNSYINAVLSGEKENQAIIDAALAVLEAFVESKKASVSKLDKLVGTKC